MDASQFTLALSARSQIAAKLASRAENDASNSGKEFASVLNQKLDRDSEQRKAEAEQRDARRNAASPTRPSSESTAATSPRSIRTTPAQSTPSSTPETTDEDQAAKVDPTDKSLQPQRPASSGNKQTPPSQKTATASSGPETATTKPSGKDAKPSATDGKQPDDEKKTATVADILTTLQNGQVSAQPAEGENSPDTGQNKKGSQKGAGAKPSTDKSGDNVAGTEGVAGTVLVTIIPLQPPIIISTTPTPINGGTGAAGLPNPVKSDGTAVDPTSVGAAGAGSDGAEPTDGKTAASTTKTVAGATALPIPGPATSTTGKVTSPVVQNETTVNSPQSGGVLPPVGSQALGDADSDFSAIIAGKVDTNPLNRGNSRVTITKSGQNSASQIPRPLLQVDNSHLEQTAVQPAPTLSEAETQPSEYQPPSEPDEFEAAAPQDFASDGTDYQPPSYLIPGDGPVGAAKTTDFLATVRQQLATASIQDQVAIHMQRAAKDGVDNISIELSPSELGHIHVKMNVDEDKQVSATITVERPSTLELLQKDTKTLERTLQEAGLKTDSGSLSFSLQRGNQGDSSDTPGWGQAGRQTGSSRQEKNAATTEVSSSARSNEVDTANGLVNVAV